MNIIIKLKAWGILPVRRRDIVRYAMEVLDRKEFCGLCALFQQALLDFNIWHVNEKVVLPLFCIDNAVKFQNGIR